MVLELSSFSEKSSSSIPEEELSTVESKSFSVKEEAEEMSLTEVESGVPLPIQDLYRKDPR